MPTLPIIILIAIALLLSAGAIGFIVASLAALAPWVLAGFALWILWRWLDISKSPEEKP